MFGGVRALTGVATAQGDLIAVAAQSTVALFDGRRLTPFDREVVFARELAFDPAGGALYVGAQSELAALACATPWLTPHASPLPPALPPTVPPHAVREPLPRPPSETPAE